jgi:hypothetical protein
LLTSALAIAASLLPQCPQIRFSHREVATHFCVVVLAICGVDGGKGKEAGSNAKSGK